MKSNRKLSTFFSFICFVCILVGCEGANSDPHTPTIHSTPPKEIQLSPTPKEQLNDFQMRSKDGMRLIHIPGGNFQMGSTYSEIEDGIELCKEHYHICNRWYYERESPAHPVSLDPFWIDQTEVSNDQYRFCEAAGVCPEPITYKKGEPTYNDSEKADHMRRFPGPRTWMMTVSSLPKVDCLKKCNFLSGFGESSIYYDPVIRFRL